MIRTNGWMVVLAAAALVAGCGEDSTEPGGDGGTGGIGGSGGTGGTGGTGGGETHPWDSLPQDPTLADDVEAPALSSGSEVIVFANGRLSDINSAYTVNRIEESHILGGDVFVYDPMQPGKLLLVGRPDYGRVDATQFVGPNPRERQKLLTRELAWSPELGLWAIQIEPINDEWLLARWDLTDFATPDQKFDVQLWSLPVETDKLDTLYWEDRIAGLGFVDGMLYASSSGDPRADQTQGGQLYALDIDLPPTYADFPPPNDNWYMDAVIPGPLLTLPDHVGFSGDIVGENGTIWTLGLHEKGSGPSDVNFLLEIDLEAQTVTQAPRVIELRNDQADVEVLAVIDHTLYGITVEGLVLAIDRELGTAEVHDDLGLLFRDLDPIRIRGGTRVVIP